MLDMINIFEVFLPQLLRYPNPNDPLNGEAAALLMRHPKEYEQKVKGMSLVINPYLIFLTPPIDYVQRFATKEAADATGGAEEDDDKEEELSDIGSFSDQDEP